MARRVLFVIRSKLGDTLVAYATVRRYANAFPADEVNLLTRSGYAALLAGEAGVRVIGFSSRTRPPLVASGWQSLEGHCEEKSCATPFCIEAAVRTFGGEPPLAVLTGTPAGCTPRAYPLDRLAEVAVDENTRHQA